MTQAVGWIHAPASYANVPQGGAVNSELMSYDDTANGALPYLQSMNHNPIDVGDNLPTPNTPYPNEGKITAASANQTWWGFPTWRETLSPLWNDPTWQVNVNLSQPNGLTPLSYPATSSEIANGYVSTSRWLLPAMNTNWRVTPQPFTDGYGDNPNLFFPYPNGQSYNTLWSYQSWEDDLIMTNVRSFDVKAYDNVYAGYVDLGWGDDVRINTTSTTPQFLNQTPLYWSWNAQGNVQTLTSTFAHEGRMPPLTTDNVYDARYGNTTYAGYTYTGNIGDNAVGVVRLRRVWDSWSTEYSKAPDTGINNVTGAANYGFPVGPYVGTPPVYPSYPAPYQAPLRGIQIQIRVVDPTNQQIKSITIRQDFTEKL